MRRIASALLVLSFFALPYTGVIVGVTPAGAAPTAAFISVESGNDHTCALLDDGRSVCWGANAYGRLGNNSEIDSPVPVEPIADAPPLAGETIAQISTGSNHTCALTANSVIACWGVNADGQLGNGTLSTSLVPKAVTLTGTPLAGKTVVQIATGTYHSCALTSLGEVSCWGSGFYLGRADATRSLEPVALTTVGTPLAGKTIVEIAVGELHSCALTADNVVACWGHGSLGALGHADFSDAQLAVDVKTTLPPLAGKTISAISAGNSSTCAIAEGGAYCWGAPGTLGNGSTDGSSVPVAVTATGAGPLAGKTVVSVSPSSTHTCALTADGVGACWGDSGLGHASIDDWPEPLAITTAGTPLADPLKLTSLTTGAHHTCATVSDGSAACWGDNAFGQLGNGLTAVSNLAVSVVGLAPIGGLPTAPAISGVALSNGGATLTWSVPESEGASAITGYVVTPYRGAVAQSATTFASTGTTQTVVGLTNGVEYSFRVAAQNAIGTGPKSAASALVVLGLPSAPTIGTAVAGDHEVTVNWTAPASAGGAPITAYVLTQYENGNRVPPLLTFNSPATTQSRVNLVNGLPYSFSVAAKNSFGTGPASAISNEVTLSAVPSVPTIGTAVAGNARATVNWSAPANTGGFPITGYSVIPFIGAAAQAPRPFASTATTQVVTGLVNGTSYTFRVAATTVVGTGAGSVTSNVVTPDGTAPIASMSTTSPGRWTLSTAVPAAWSAVDVGTGVAAFDVAKRSGAWSAAHLGVTSTPWLIGVTAKAGVFTGTPGSTYCIKVRAKDKAANLSGFSAERCTAVPRRAGQLTYSQKKKWYPGTHAQSYNRSYYRTEVDGASLTQKGISARRIALIAWRCASCGSVKVYWNGAYRKTVSLKGSGHQQVVELLAFPTVTSGTLMIEAATANRGSGSSPRPVIVEGLGISKSGA